MKQLTPELLDAARVCAAQFQAKDGTRPVRVTSKLAPVVLFLFTSRRGDPCVFGFIGKSGKPAAHYRFGNEAKRHAWVERFLADQAVAHAAHEARKSKQRQDNVRKLAVGDVLRSSWGYDQTNVDYYEVVALVGKAYVDIRKIAAESLGTNHDQGVCIPCPGNYLGEPMRKLAQGDRVRIYSFASAYKVTPTLVAGGTTKVWSVDCWSSGH